MNQRILAALQDAGADNLTLVGILGLVLLGFAALLVARVALRVVERNQRRIYNLQQDLADLKAEQKYAPQPFTPPARPAMAPPPEGPATVFEGGRGRVVRSHRADDTLVDKS